MDSLAEGLLEALWEALGTEGFATTALVGLVGIVFGPRQGLVLALGFATIYLVAERDEYISHVDPWPAHHVERTASLIEQLGDPEKADRAESRLIGRCRLVGARALLEQALVAPTTSADESQGDSPYRRMARVLANDDERDLSWAIEWPLDFLSRQLDGTRDHARRAILWELLFAAGGDEIGRIWREHEQDPEVELPAMRGLTAALVETRLSTRLRRELIDPLTIRLVGEPASDDPHDPTPASLLIALDPEEAIKRLIDPEVLDLGNGRLAENLRAMTEAGLVLGISVHESLIADLRREALDDPYLSEALREAVTMLALRADGATRDRLEKLRLEPMMRAGAERGLAIMGAREADNDGRRPAGNGEMR